MALPCGGRRAATLLHPPLSSSTLPQGRDVALKRYCSEPLKINERSGGMKGKRSPSVPGRSLLYCPDLGQGNFLLPAPHLEGCAEGFLVQDLSEVLLLIILEMPRAQVREHAFQRGGRASPAVHPWRGAVGQAQGTGWHPSWSGGEKSYSATAEQPSGTRVPRAARRQSR